MNDYRRQERHEQILACLPAHGVVRLATLSAESAHGLHGEDRLSALHEDIRRNIVSRLPIKDAVRTTALASWWSGTWHDTPLNLYDAHLLPSRGTVRARIVDGVLNSHHGPFNAVHLENCFTPNDKVLEEWSRLLAARGVQDLVLVSLHPPYRTLDGRGLSVRLPADILRCDNLRRLYLAFWTFPDTSNLPDGAGVFPHLEELCIIDTPMEHSDLDHMLASSPSLKKLALISDVKLMQVHLRSQSLQCLFFWLSKRVQHVLLDTQNLERLIMWRKPPVEVMIASATRLKALGFFELGADKLKIGDTVIQIRTGVSTITITMIPSVKILALNVDLSSFKMVQMLSRFLRCFPSIETLHLECYHNEPTGNADEFFENLEPIDCVQTQIKKVVIHKFRGHQTEMALLRYLSQTANQMQQLTLVMLQYWPDEISKGRIKGQLADLVIPPWASEACTLLLLKPASKHPWTFHRASDLSTQDPFLYDGQELFRFVKKM